uniref:Uncharacterized protein n=1 Tax=Palpitomonas bilix TaxID=652834 RepID=A0A7S3LXJ8_9EUKA|mmetsp:Transcript_8640/g.23233  ORF Transcript_8640/g.23233 Transcript_8640/m.23233 type:complete len:678 (+) Transcript_8640:343-2376(+)
MSTTKGVLVFFATLTLFAPTLTYYLRANRESGSEYYFDGSLRVLSAPNGGATPTASAKFRSIRVYNASTSNTEDVGVTLEAAGNFSKSKEDLDGFFGDLTDAAAVSKANEGLALLKNTTRAWNASTLVTQLDQFNATEVAAKFMAKSKKFLSQIADLSPPPISFFSDAGIGGQLKKYIIKRAIKGGFLPFSSSTSSESFSFDDGTGMSSCTIEPTIGVVSMSMKEIRVMRGCAAPLSGGANGDEDDVTVTIVPCLSEVNGTLKIWGKISNATDMFEIAHYDTSHTTLVDMTLTGLKGTPDKFGSLFVVTQQHTAGASANTTESKYKVEWFGLDSNSSHPRRHATFSLPSSTLIDMNVAGTIIPAGISNTKNGVATYNLTQLDYLFHTNRSGLQCVQLHVNYAESMLDSSAVANVTHVDNNIGKYIQGYQNGSELRMLRYFEHKLNSTNTVSHLVAAYNDGGLKVLKNMSVVFADVALARERYTLPAAFDVFEREGVSRTPSNNITGDEFDIVRMSAVASSSTPNMDTMKVLDDLMTSSGGVSGVANMDDDKKEEVVYYIRKLSTVLNTSMVENITENDMYSHQIREFVVPVSLLPANSSSVKNNRAGTEPPPTQLESVLDKLKTSTIGGQLGGQQVASSLSSSKVVTELERIPLDAALLESTSAGAALEGLNIRHLF